LLAKEYLRVGTYCAGAALPALLAIASTRAVLAMANVAVQAAPEVAEQNQPVFASSRRLLPIAPSEPRSRLQAFDHFWPQLATEFR